MKFYNNADELVDNELPIHIRAQLYPLIENGVRAYQEFVYEHFKTFDSAFINNLKGWLLTYMIFRQFEQDMVSSNFPFLCEAQKVNNFQYKSLNLTRGNVMINLGKARDEYAFPHRSKYRIRNCRNNRFTEETLFLGVDKSNNFIVKNEHYYLLLTYGYKNGNIGFANLIVPNYKMTKFEKACDLKTEFRLYNNNAGMQSNVEKKVAFIKDEVLQKLKLIKKEEA
ncbi:hypothetical protein [Desulforamulus aquiferis]|uniref:Uncharacterized protein n=1 Tax=Desulforamulus aquiferis TaxID=1397668 RepID=A0AAW7ZCX6_9FIRM|nr:hypothetical protein [Desulforamulus aquiferis]MDO7787105.1 hypothetical protein [Desulforamulus aquiferis]